MARATDNRNGRDNRNNRLVMMNDQGAERLAAAIVRQAADDYEGVLMQMLRKPAPAEMKALKTRKAENEKYFLSPWCDMLLRLTDGQTLMKQVQKNAVRKEKERVQKKLEKAKKGLEDRIRKGV